MKLIDRLILKELFIPFLIGTISVAMMFDANLMIAIQKDFNVSSVPALAIGQFILYKTPSFMNMTLPVGTSLAASLAFTRLARESEITAMRTAGASIRRILRPVLIFGAFVAFGNYLLVEKVMPISEKKAASLQRQIGVLVVMPQLSQTNAFRVDKYSVFIGGVQQTGKEAMTLNDVLLFSREKQGEVEFITAETGSYDRGQWRLRNAYVRWFKGPDLQQAYVKNEFALNKRVSLQEMITPAAPEEQTVGQIREAMLLAQSAGRPDQYLAMQYYMRYSFPVACLVFAFVSPLLAIFFAKSGGFAGVLMSLAIALLYFNVHVISTQILGKNGTINPIMAAWLPNLFFVIVGLIALWRLE